MRGKFGFIIIRGSLDRALDNDSSMCCRPWENRHTATIAALGKTSTPWKTKAIKKMERRDELSARPKQITGSI
jgi:hypothetical protein